MQRIWNSNIFVRETRKLGSRAQRTRGRDERLTNKRFKISGDKREISLSCLLPVLVLIVLHFSEHGQSYIARRDGEFAHQKDEGRYKAVAQSKFASLLRALSYSFLMCKFIIPPCTA